MVRGFCPTCHYDCKANMTQALEWISKIRLLTQVWLLYLYKILFHPFGQSKKTQLFFHKVLTMG